MPFSVKCNISGVEHSLSLDNPPKPGQTIKIDGVERKIVRVVKNKFMDQQPIFSIEVE
jgi:hypothetical protein